MSRTICPVGDKIAIELAKKETKTASGIILPESSEKPQEGTVLAVGEGKLLENGKRVTPSVKVGDRVVFGKWGGTEVEVDGRKVTLISESELFAVLS